MQKVTVITCFSYHNNKKYIFHPSHLRSDLRRIISFSHNRIGCDLDKMYVLTDIEPSPIICGEILEEFHLEVKKILSGHTLIGSIEWPTLSTVQLSNIFEHVSDCVDKPLKWLKGVCIHACMMSKLSINHSIIYESLLQRIVPVIRNASIVEFASLFTKFALITGPQHYQNVLNTIFVKPVSHLFFYYTGHGIKFYANPTSSKYDVSLVIPDQASAPENVGFFSQKQLQKCFNRILTNTNAFIVFDCCHAERLLQLPLKGNSQIIYLSSTQKDQTCGFYNSKRECGSVYTYYLMKFLDLVANRLQKSCKERYIVKFHLAQLYDHVEEKVNKYRLSSGKPPQNMFVNLSNSKISHLPDWLFGRIILKHEYRHCLTLVDAAD